MSEIQVKKKKPLINDGGHKPFGVDLDPDKKLCHVTEEDGSQSTYHNGDKISYDDYVNNLEETMHRRSQGKSTSSIRTFGGFGSGTLKKPYKTKK